MNCDRCHHTDEAHVQDRQGGSLMRRGRCSIPTCTCRQYVDPIHEIDEELL